MRLLVLVSNSLLVSLVIFACVVDSYMNLPIGVDPFWASGMTNLPQTEGIAARWLVLSWCL